MLREVRRGFFQDVALRRELADLLAHPSRTMNVEPARTSYRSPWQTISASIDETAVTKRFISHSSANNAAALALACRLDRPGWSDRVLDCRLRAGYEAERAFPGNPLFQKVRQAGERALQPAGPTAKKRSEATHAQSPSIAIATMR